MTPQTAAALRALEQSWRAMSHEKHYPQNVVFVECADELAAVLTQEGVDKEIDWVVHFPPAEPRAAEGAGTDNT